MSFNLWLLLIGGLLLVMAVAHPEVQRRPVTAAIIYLLIGVALGPSGLALVRIDPLVHATWLHHAAEIAVIVSLFTVGLKPRLGPWDRRLRPALCLAFVSMVLTVGMIAGAAVAWLGLSLGAAVLLGGILAPTDPVLASDVQLKHARDRDRVRLTLTAEAGFNDGTAFPFVMLGLAWLQGRDLGPGAWRWWSIDVVWAVGAGLAIGALLGHGFGRLLLHLQQAKGKPVAFGEYLVLGLIGISYAVAVEAKAYGFLSVFAAGFALRQVEWTATTAGSGRDRTTTAPSLEALSGKLAANPQTAPAYFTNVLLTTNELLEHLLEVALVLLVGATLLSHGLAPEIWWFGPVLFLVIRPLAVLPVLLTAPLARREFTAIAWFGVRGIGSLYYLMYAIDAGLPAPLAQRLTSLTLTVVALSIIVHGVSVTPFFARPPKRDGAG